MVLGLYAASRLPLWSTIVLALATKMVVGAIIRDNLTLNIIMLIDPLDVIKHWQAGT